MLHTGFLGRGGRRTITGTDDRSVVAGGGGRGEGRTREARSGVLWGGDGTLRQPPGAAPAAGSLEPSVCRPVWGRTPGTAAQSVTKGWAEPAGTCSSRPWLRDWILKPHGTGGGDSLGHQTPPDAWLPYCDSCRMFLVSWESSVSLGDMNTTYLSVCLCVYRSTVCLSNVYAHVQLTTET